MNRRHLLSLLAAPLVAEGPLTTVFLVRHADRDHGQDPDEPINGAGMERAEELARVLADAQITKIFVTEFKRTEMTAAPLAKKLALKTTSLPQAEVARWKAALEALPAGSAALVVSHSDKVPLLVSAMGEKGAPIAATEYDRLTVLTLQHGKVVGVKTLRFGHHSQR